MFAASACVRLQESIRCAAALAAPLRALSTAAAATESIPLTKLWKGIKKAPRATSSKQSGSRLVREVIAQDQPYRQVPDNATPKTMNTDIMSFLNWRGVARRRQELNVPVFFPGSILQITALDSAAASRPRTFVGICIARTNKGLGSTVTLRNSVDDIAIEKQYHIYSPLVKEIKVLKYERARRAKLYYLRGRPARESYVNPKTYGVTF